MEAIRHVCDKCHMSFALGKDTQLTFFMKVPGMSYAQTECPRTHCEEVNTVWLCRSNRSYGDYHKRGWDVRSSDYPSASDYDMYEEANGPGVKTDFKLTPRLAEEVDRFAKVMKNTPDDLLYDALTTVSKPTMPKRWA
jgi:hypothetical protein